MRAEIGDSLTQGGPPRRRRVLVTGGNGFVGRPTVRRLMADHDVTVIDTLRYSDWRFTVDERERLTLSTVNICDRDAVAALVAACRPDVIVHLAAIHYIPECEDDPAEAVDVNVTGTVNLLTAAPQGSRFVFTSSGAVYAPEDAPHNEDVSPIRPSDVYGFSKAHGEDYVRYLAAKRGLSAAIVRLFNVVGPGETNPHVLPEIVAQLKCRRTTIHLGNMTPKRDYIDVRDAADGFVAVALGPGAPLGETHTVNLGTSRTYSVSEMVERLRCVSGVPFCVEQDPRRLRKVDRPHLAADTRRIRELYGWTPAHTLDDAVAAVWNDPDMSPALAKKYQDG